MAPRPTVQPPVCAPLCALCYREEALRFYAFLALLRWLLCLECSPLPYPVSPDLMLYLNALPGLNAGRRVSDEGCSLFLEERWSSPVIPRPLITLIEPQQHGGFLQVTVSAHPLILTQVS